MLGSRLRSLREQSGITSQQTLAEALGVAQSTVANWECGRREPSHEILVKLADFYNVTVDYLMGRSDDPHGPKLNDAALKAALWGGDADLSEADMEELWQDVREYAAYKAAQCKKRNR